MTISIASSAVVLEVLRNDNYENWSVCLKSYLLAQDLWDIIEETTEPPKPEDGKADLKNWRKNNAAALHAIQISCAPDILSQIREISLAKIAWEILAKMHKPQLLGVSPGNPKQSPAVNPEQSPGAEIGNMSISQGEVNPPESLREISNESPPQSFKVQNSDHLQFQPLYNTVKKGDWDDVKEFIELNPNAVKVKFTSIRFTALHVACNAGHLKIVETLVQFMSDEDLAIQNQFGETALFNVATAGITKIAECMIKRNKYLACIKDNGGDLPVTAASTYGHKDMTRYLYSVTPIDLLFPEKGNQGPELLSCSIFSGMYDVALDLLRRCPSLTTIRNSRGIIPLVRLASMPNAFPSGSQLSFWQRWIYSYTHVHLPTASNDIRISVIHNGQSERDYILALTVLGQLRHLFSNLLKFIGIKKIYETKWTHIHALELLRCMCREISISDLDENYKQAQRDAIYEATKHGIVEFIIEMTKVDPDLLYQETNSRVIFMSGISHHQEKIFNLLYGLDTRKYECVVVVDHSYNNMLDMAGMLPPTSQLAPMPGAALQMQRELQWFKEVKSIMPQMFQEYLNQEKETPRQVFTRNHKKLVKQGEKWMKDTATSCTVVGALIMTIMFAAVFTVPGGDNQNTGFPLFLHQKYFMVFIISDAISLLSSSASVLMFLGILTSRYTEDDFLTSLPTKLLIGLSTLFFSTATMIVAFSTALFIMLDGYSWITIDPIILLASVPVILFLLLQFPLFVEIFMSTYGPSIFDRKIRP